MSTVTFLNHTAKLALGGSFRRFLRDTTRIPQFQEQYLLKLLHKNSQSAFGRHYDFKHIDSVKRFQDTVPIQDYEGFRPWIEKIINGEPKVLTTEPVILMEPTGGTSSGSKLIPYTQTLKSEFQRAVHPWLYDLYCQYPGLLGGRSYWSISPAFTGNHKTPGGIPIGFDQDADYLGLMGHIQQRLFAVPASVKALHNVEDFRFATNFYLLSCRDLTLISVWNPTFLTLLIEYIESHPHDLVRAIFDKGNQERAHELEQGFAYEGAERYRRIWPQLTLISCWASPLMQQEPLNEITRLFAHASVQPKGLLATEGVMTIPLAAAKGAVACYRSHFFEFLPEEEASPVLLGQLEPGQIYHILLTTGGGLYRYNIKDRIIVTGRYKNLPVIEFCGRAKTSDLAGEKLDEQHVASALQQTMSHHATAAKFLMIAPHIEQGKACYTLYLEPVQSLTIATYQAIQTELERLLCENFHYEYARKLEQLAPIAIYLIDHDGLKTYQKRCMEEGNQRLGDIKQTLLDTRSDWSLKFEGRFINLG